MSSSSTKTVTLRWSGRGLIFQGGGDAGGEITIDGDTVVGPSPMDTLLLALAGCMGADVCSILESSHVPLTSLEIEITGTRPADPPRRFIKIDLLYRLSGPQEEHAKKVQRAVDLSRDKYCSVLHTLDPNLDVGIEVETT